MSHEQERKLFLDFTTYFAGELEKNFVEMGDAEVPTAFVVGQLRHHQLGKRGRRGLRGHGGKTHIDVTRMPMLLLDVLAVTDYRVVQTQCSEKFVLTNI